MSDKQEKYAVKVYGEDNLAKSNVLIQSKYKTTVLGNKLIALGLFHLQKGQFKMSANGGNIVCTIPAAEIRNKLGKKGNSLYRDLSETSKRLMNYQFGYKDAERQEFRYINLFTEMSYKDGEFTIIFNGDMKVYLSELKDNYTLLNLPLMLKWQKAYTFRLFEILSSRTYLFKDQNYNCAAEFGLAELKFTLGCYDIDDEKVRIYIKDKKNPNYEMAEQALYDNKKPSSKVSKTQVLLWTDFRRNVLEPAIKEINSTVEADMIIDEVEALKNGRGGKVYGVVFRYRVNVNAGNAMDEVAATVEKVALTEDEMFDIEAQVKGDILSRHKLPISDVRTICEAAEYDADIIKRAADQLSLQHAKVDNVTGWLVSCIKNQYKTTAYQAEEKSDKKKKNSFHNFPEREYSQIELDDLEQKLLQRKYSTEEE